MTPSRFVLPAILTFTAALAPAPAQQDAPPIDPTKLIEALKALKEQQTTNVKASRQKLLQSAQAGAASPAAATAAWVEAIRQTQFEGVEKEGAQFREWREREGPLFAEKEVQAAAQLHFRWLALTTQRALGATTKELLPKIVEYARDVLADAQAIEAFALHAQKEKDRAQTGRPGVQRAPGRNVGDEDRGRRQNNGPVTEEDRVKRLHDQILSRALPASPTVKALHAEELIKIEGWEYKPGDVDAIYQHIVLPELRSTHDQRVLEYWDLKLKLEAEAVKDAPAFDQEKFNKERRPELQWSRSKEYLELGLKNKGIGELFQILKANPQHPKFNEWVGELEKEISPESSATPPAGALPGSK